MQEVYNATVTGKILLTQELMILRLRSDEPRNEFKAGQFTQIGLLAGEPRSAHSTVPIEELADDFLIKRPYSIASAKTETRDFEFYISHVKSGQLTPRLFSLQQGNRMWIDDNILGIFSLNDVPQNTNIVMIATGTGLAPYISFLRSHIADHPEIKMAVIHGAANPWDLGYYSELTLLQKLFKNFHYFPTLLKADDSWTGLCGYIEEHLKSGLLEEHGIENNPNKTHYFLCGNPKMVESVSSFLFEKNYTKHTKKSAGALHIEEY